jgi:hypothetical protein
MRNAKRVFETRSVSLVHGSMPAVLNIATGKKNVHTPYQFPEIYLQTKRLHCKKRLSFFPSPAGMSLIKLSMAGNNLIIPGQGEFG